MPLTLEEYDHKVGHHLRMIRHHAAMLTAHAEMMTHQPGFDTLAEEDLAKCREGLGRALERVAYATSLYREKPHDN